jgi:hypothetical protein
MIPPGDRASGGTCDADPNCAHVACFQVRLEASQPRQSNACAYHVADVIQALRAWAGQRTLVDGQLTILAIEPTAGGRQPGRPDQPGLRGFAFSTIPLAPPRRREPEASVASAAAPAEQPEG